MVGKVWASSIVLALASWVAVPSVAQTQRASPGSEIVVTAVRSHLSNWRQAETSHVTLVSDVPEGELIQLSRNLERLHFLLSGLMGRGAVDDDTVKLHITLIGDVAQFDAMDLHNTRWQQGPYSDLFRVSRYYDPREDGAVMASIGADQNVVVEHTPTNVHAVADILSSMAMSTSVKDRDEMFAAISSMESFASPAMKGRHDNGMGFGEKTMTMTEESMLYVGYAQHFLLTYFPAAYPRWYLDGFGQIFATMAVRGDNILEFGHAPEGTTAVMHSFGPYPIKDVLDDAYLTQDPHRTGWTPIHAWMLAHFLFFSDKYRPELRQYLALRAQGVDSATAAKVFGDQKQLAHDLGSYFMTRKPYLQITYDGSKIEQPIVHRLRESEAAFIKGRLELGARVEIPSAPTADTPLNEAATMIHKREDALRQRNKWLAGLRRDAARWSGELEAQLLLAEAECRSGNPSECLAAAKRAETIAPSDTRMMVWKGFAMVQQAASAPAANRAAMLASARDLIVQANQIDHEAIGPMMAYYASFADVGEAPSATAIDGLQKAMEEVPAAPETRLTLASALARRGQYDVARPVIMPVAAGAYDTPEKPAAKALLAQLDAATSTGAQPSLPTPAEPPKSNGARPAPSTGASPPVHP